MKKLFAKLKTLYDAHKIVMFIVSFFVVGTNAMQAGVQEYVRSGPVNMVELKAGPPIEKVKPVAVGPQIIIRKVDNQFCIDLLEKHKTGAQH